MRLLLLAVPPSHAADDVVVAPEQLLAVGLVFRREDPLVPDLVEVFDGNTLVHIGNHHLLMELAWIGHTTIYRYPCPDGLR